MRMIHIGKRTTKQTLCGKPVARRWWVEAAHTECNTIGRLVVAERVEPRGATVSKQKTEIKPGQIWRGKPTTMR